MPRKLTTIMTKSLRLEGFIVLDHMGLQQQFLAFSGEDLGRTLVKLG